MKIPEESLHDEAIIGRGLARWTGPVGLAGDLIEGRVDLQPELTSNTDHLIRSR